jgi:hypothetical protein
VTRMFENNPDVAFADIDLSESPMITGAELGNPGSEGWPTIRFFNKKTGVYGAAYKKRTPLPMCNELGDYQMMIDYVEDYSNTVLCGLDGTNCNDKELDYVEKWKIKPVEEVENQLSRLEAMSSRPMNEDRLEWTVRRIRILKKVVKATGKKGPSGETDEF